jgi:hypothetical protein
MKKHFINALVAVGLLATLNSCSKDEDIKPTEKDNQKTSQNSDLPQYHPLDPNGFGFIRLEEGELYYYFDSLSTFSQVGKKYLTMKPLNLEKYKNGSLLDSVCNQDLAIRFESKALKSHDKQTKWGTSPSRVVDEYPAVVTITTGIKTTIKLSKMVTAFGFEFNSPYKGYGYGVEVRYRNSKTNSLLPTAIVSYLDNDTRFGPVLGSTGGAWIRGVETVEQFDGVIVTFIKGFQAGVLYPPFDLSLGGFRYKLAK